MTPERIQINVLFFGACREAADVSEALFELEALATVATAWAAVKEKYPMLAGFERHALFAVNEEHARATQAIQSGDVLAIFPPVSGG